MKPPPFTYHRPDTVEEATSLLATLGDEAKVLAGGQSLVPLLNFRLANPAHLVDIGGVAGLDGIDVSHVAITVGAGVRQAALERNEDAAAANPLLRTALGHVAHQVIRNRGTVCGSLAHGDPASELVATLAVLDGHVTAARYSDGAVTRRTIGADELFVGPLQTSLDPEDLVESVTFPSLRANTGVAVAELARRHGDYAIAGVVMTASVDPEGTPTAVRAAYLSVAPTPVVIDLTEPVANGADDAALAAHVGTDLDPTGDQHATAEYRRHLAGVLTGRALATALAGARSSSTDGSTDA
ncbi:MAG: FAD binding domain-containing protein [Actinomycetota bacterium]|nr:FAD binding domain-containing protein [Actinomycetota bacterium]